MTNLPGPSNRRRGARGAAMTEYTVLLGVVAIASLGAFVGLGVALVDSFEARRDLLLYPSP
jgi:Flp pilus assembly pilin Flp